MFILSDVESRLANIHLEFDKEKFKREVSELKPRFSLPQPLAKLIKTPIKNSWVIGITSLLIVNGALGFYKYKPLATIAEYAKSALGKEVSLQAYFENKKYNYAPRKFALTSGGKSSVEKARNNIVYAQSDLFVNNISSEIEELKKQVANLATRKSEFGKEKPCRA